MQLDDHALGGSLMKTIGFALLFVIGCTGRIQTAQAETAHMACMPPSAFADGFRSYVVELTTSSDSVQQLVRTGADLPVVTDTSQIVFVNDSAVCARAAAAHAIAAQQAGTPLPVYVLRVSTTRYVVFNGSSAGEFLAYYIFDQNFTLLSSLAS
jgi:hypothetical protein